MVSKSTDKFRLIEAKKNITKDPVKSEFAEDDMQNIEIWDLYDKQRHLMGRDHIRGEEIPQGY